MTTNFAAIQKKMFSSSQHFNYSPMLLTLKLRLQIIKCKSVKSLRAIKIHCPPFKKYTPTLPLLRFAIVCVNTAHSKGV